MSHKCRILVIWYFLASCDRVQPISGLYDRQGPSCLQIDTVPAHVPFGSPLHRPRERFLRVRPRVILPG